MAVRAGGKVEGVRYAGSSTYSPLTVIGLDTPVLSNITEDSFVMTYIPSVAGMLSVIVTSLTANQPTNAAFNASGDIQPVDALGTYTMEHISIFDNDKSRVWVQLNTGIQRITRSVEVEYLKNVLSSFFITDF